MAEDADDNDPADALTIAPKKAFSIIVRRGSSTRRWRPPTPNSGSNPADDREVNVLESQPDDPTLEELEDALVGLNLDEQLDLLALTWLRPAICELRAGPRRGGGLAGQAHPVLPDRHAQLGDYMRKVSRHRAILEDFAVHRL